MYQLVADDLPAQFPPLRNASEHTRATRVVIADDSTLLREGLARLLEEAGIEVVGQARNAPELLLKVRSYTPDLAIVDIRMPPTQTDEGIRAARRSGRSTPAPACSSFPSTSPTPTRPSSWPTAPRGSDTC